MIKDYLLIYETTKSEAVYGTSNFVRKNITTMREITLKGKSLVDVVNYAYNSLDLEDIIEVVEVR